MADRPSRLRKAEDEIAELRAEVEALRASQAIEAATHGHGCCHSHCCGHVHWYGHWPYTITMGAAPQPYYSTVTTTNAGYCQPAINTAGAAGYSTTYTITS